LENRI